MLKQLLQVAVLLAFAALFLAYDASAITPPVTGCITGFSSTNYVRLPWMNATKNAGPSFYNAGKHKDCNRTDKVNDYYALDFALSSGSSVYSTTAGTVYFVGDLTGGWCSYGKVVIIQESGTRSNFWHMYAHLDSYSVTIGQSVSVNALIAKSGKSSCDTTLTAHLHYVVYKDALFLNTQNAKGPYGGKGVVPEPMKDLYCSSNKVYENLTSGQPIIACKP